MSMSRRRKDPISVPQPRAAARIHLLPLAFVVIWACTALSVELAPPRVGVNLWEIGFDDIVVNVLLYVPLGLALRRERFFACVLVAAGLSVTVETIQLFYVSRFTAVWDVVANVAGAVTGWWWFGRVSPELAWSLDRIELNRRIGVVAVVLFFVFTVLLSVPGEPSDFSNWDPDCRLTVRDELGRDRPWDGDIERMAIYASCLRAGTIGRLAEKGATSLLDQSIGIGTPLYTARMSDEPDSTRGSPLLGPEEHEDFFETLVRNGTLSVLVWFVTHNEGQSGPARIVSFSKAPVEQNFAIGQEGRRIIFRLRTRTTVPGGYFPQTGTRDILRSGVPAFVAATFDGRNTRVYFNGRQEGRTNLLAHGRPSPFLSDSGLPAAAVLLGALMAVGLLGVAHRWRVRGRWIIGSIGGALGAFLFTLAGGADALPEFALWVPPLGMWGGLMIAAAVTRDGASCKDCDVDWGNR
jgi:VanZ family protein